ncbi:DUF6243 family protein [Streptomyces sp. NPDC004610]|uniref:DUF6243 family protein n=1 Tax=unclassified Streptomyces TaxID=2593676 RepID=UPI0033A844CA
MSRGGNMLGVGGTRKNLGRKQLRGGRAEAGFGAGADAQAQKQELLRKLQERREQREQEAPES